jgi:phytoene dehydrogenase-like protein
MKNFSINTKINPKGLKKDEYDCIIIGAGIGGLVCGCYLAKAGMKVLIVEKNEKVGGYCQSFVKDGFWFDTGAHYLGSLRRSGALRKIFDDLRLDKEIKLIRSDPSDIVITNDYRIEIRNDIKQTIDNFQTHFPQQAKEI